MILQQDFSACTRVNEKWLADIVYIATKEGWLHLAVVMDAFGTRQKLWAGL